VIDFPQPEIRGRVSVVLPCHNRAAFLPDALAAIQGQTFKEWELILVDDGSTDGTDELVRERTKGIRQRVEIVWQENAGAYAARAKGLLHAAGEFIAFYDSDDIWMSHHLLDCVAALQTHLEVDWVYGPDRAVDASTGQVLVANRFVEGGEPKVFRRLETRASAGLRIIVDANLVTCAIEHGLYSGLQSSVIRRRIFEQVRFRGDLRNGEDRFFAVRAAKAGCTFGYFDNIHVIYRVHSDHSSLANAKTDTESARIRLQIIEGYEDLLATESLDEAERRALCRRLAKEYFWHLGYGVYWRAGEFDLAMEAFRAGLHFDRTNPKMWKTFVLSHVRSLIAKLTGAGSNGPLSTGLDSDPENRE